MDYITVARAASCELSEKRSRFIASVSRAGTAQEAEEFLARVRADNPGARHNVFAWVLRGGARRCSDDGEPQGTGGQPVLTLLERRGLTDTAVVVTRYFGGVLLGAPGLLRAYSGAAALALDKAGSVRMISCARLRAVVEYSELESLKRLAAQFRGAVSAAEYTDKVTLEITLPEREADGFIEKVFSFTSGASRPVRTGECHMAEESFGASRE